MDDSGNVTEQGRGFGFGLGFGNVSGLRPLFTRDLRAFNWPDHLMPSSLYLFTVASAYKKVTNAVNRNEMTVTNIMIHHSQASRSTPDSCCVAHCTEPRSLTG